MTEGEVIDIRAVMAKHGVPMPEKFFDKSGLQVVTLAHHIMQMGPLAIGVDNLDWEYDEGVWRPAPAVIYDRTVELLGERFRNSHATNARAVVHAVLRSEGRVITSEPVSEYINMRNGLLDWRTGELDAHDPDVMTTVQLTVDWDPDADCPAFEKWLSEVVEPDVVPQMWELLGYLMYSGNPLHTAVMLTGTGRNGKGTFLRAVTGILGRHNITSVSLHDLINTRFTTASLFGKIANIAGDIDAKYLESTATLKAITGEDMVSAEHKGKDRFDFVPWAVPVFSANKVPGSADVTIGYLARWIVINFPNTFVGREDRTLDERLAAEYPGVVTRAVTALRQLLDRGGFELGDTAQRATEEFRRHVDQVATWVADCCELWPPHPHVNRTQLYKMYRRWCERDGYRPVRAGEFYERLEALGAEPKTVMGNRGFVGIKVIDDAWN